MSPRGAQDVEARRTCRARRSGCRRIPASCVGEPFVAPRSSKIDEFSCSGRRHVVWSCVDVARWRPGRRPRWCPRHPARRLYRHDEMHSPIAVGRRSAPPIRQRRRRIEQPAQCRVQFGRRHVVLQHPAGVGHRSLEDVQVVVQRIQLTACHHEFAVAQRQLPRPLTRHPVPLSARLRTELPWPARPVVLGQREATPPAPPLGRSSAPLVRVR